jgi:hypothetical protein
MTYQVDILNPKAYKLLQDLEDLNLFSLLKEASNDPFLAVVKRLRKNAAPKPPSLKEITKHLEIVRAKRYANKKKA